MADLTLSDVNIPQGGSGKVWLTLGGIMAGLGAGIRYVVTNWEKIEPILNNSMIVGTLIFILLLGGIALGMFIVYQFLLRPEKARSSAIAKLAQELTDEKTELRELIARLETRLEERDNRDAEIAKMMRDMGTARGT